jgi:hypothetical protein
MLTFNMPGIPADGKDAGSEFATIKASIHIA